MFCQRCSLMVGLVRSLSRKESWTSALKSATRINFHPGKDTCGGKERVMPREVHINKMKNKLWVVSNSGPGCNWIFLLFELVHVRCQVVLKIRRMDQGRGAANVLPEAAIVQP